MGYDDYIQDAVKLEAAWIIMHNEAVICMAKYNKDTAGSLHVARRYPNV